MASLAGIHLDGGLALVQAATQHEKSAPQQRYTAAHEILRDPEISVSDPPAPVPVYTQPPLPALHAFQARLSGFRALPLRAGGALGGAGL